MNVVNSLIWLLGTIGLFLLMKKVHLKVKSVFTLPIITSTIIIMVILSKGHISYDTYFAHTKWINDLLGPAVIAFAVPLYKQRDLLKKYGLAIAISSLIGSTIAMTTDLLFAKLAGMPQELVYSLFPKSVTMPVAMTVSSELGGQASLTAVFVVMAGMIGSAFGPALLRMGHVHTKIGKGIGFGSASHVMGVTKAFEHNDREGAIGSVSMILCAIMTCMVSIAFIQFIAI